MRTDHVSAFIAAAAIFVTAVPVQAQTLTVATADAEPDNGLQEIVVQARRIEERAQDVPISLSVFNQDQLTERNVVTAQDLAIYTPSLSVDNQFGNDNITFSIRGFAQAVGTTPSVAVYFADAVVPRGGGLENAGSGAGPGSFFDLANVEVLDGPQGTLFGRNTTGGAVLLVPQKPTSEFGGYVEGSYGNYDMGRVQGVINMPVNDNLRIRLGVDHEGRNGYLINTSGVGPRDFNNIDYTAVRFSAVLDVTPQIENYFIGTYTLSINNGPLPQLFTCHVGVGLGSLCPSQFGLSLGSPGPYPQGNYTVQNDLSGAESYSRQSQFIDTMTWRATDSLTVKNILNYGMLRTILDSDLFGSSFSVAGFPLFTQISDASSLGDNAATTDQYTFSEELQLQGEAFGGKLTYQAGVYLERSGPLGDLTGSRSPAELSCSNLASLQCIDILGAAVGAPVGVVTDQVSSIHYGDQAGFAQSSYAVNEQFKVTGGLRYTSDHTVGTSDAVVYDFPAPYTATPASCIVATASLGNNCYAVFRENSSAPTWLIDLEYRPLQDLMIYAKYSRGYRQGSVNSVSPAANIYQPEHLNSYEMGEKFAFHDAISGTFDVSAFYNDFTNQQLLVGFVSETNGVEASDILNAGKSRIYGADVNANIVPVRPLTLGVSYTYLETRLLSLTVPTFPGYEVLPDSQAGTPLPFAPHNKAALYVSYALPVAASLGKITAGAAYSYTSKTFLSALTPYGTLPSYGLLNLSLNWRSMFGHPLDVELFGTNLANKLYYTNGTSFYDNYGFEDHYLGEPRMFGARVRLHFGE